MTIALLPLDSRPCNARFPVQLAAWCGHKVLIPEREEMDDFTSPAPFAASREALLRMGEGADAFVICTDHLIYGSLLASRAYAVETKEALERLDFLRELHERFPEKPIQLVSTIMRASLSTLCAGDLEAYEAMSVYSECTDRAQTVRSSKERAALLSRAEEAKAHIPGDVLERYMQVRARNHAVNRACIALRRENVVSSLLLLMEDAPKFGFHRSEQRTLLKDMQGLTAVFLQNGTDEGGCLAVMRQILASSPMEMDVCSLGGDFTARYEDREFAENVFSCMAYLGVEYDPASPAVLAIACPSGKEQPEQESDADEAHVRAVAQRIDEMADAGRPVYLLDLIHANGGSTRLMNTLKSLDLLCGYSAWNTASNSLGTLLAQYVSDRLAGKVQTDFRNARFLDDYVYQSEIRPELNARLREEGEDPFRLRDKARAERMLQEQFDAYPGRVMQVTGGCRASLPWARTFEADIEVTADGERTEG